MNTISFAESLKIIQAEADGLLRSTEKVSTREALRRVISAPIFARRSNPPQPLAAMDGIAIDFRSASTTPARLRMGQYQRINTGEPLAPLWNAVVKIENVKWEAETALLESPVEFLQNVRGTGEDFETNSLLFVPGHCLQPQNLSLLLSAGHEEVDVYRKPVVTFMPTGSELILDSSQQQPGKVLESNSAMIAGMVESWGGVIHVTNPVPDDREILKQKIKSYASKSDILAVSAGTSKGLRDLTAEALSAVGKIFFHGVALHPSRPVVFAEVEGTPVLALPGYPVAAYIASHLFLRPLVCSLSGVHAKLPQATFISAEDLDPREVDQIYRVNLCEVDGQIYARKIVRGASSLSSLSQMDGLMHVPSDTSIRKRDAVRIEVIQDRSQNTVMVRGVSDPIALRLFDWLREAMPAHRILLSETAPQEALQNIIERSTHAAIISVPSGGLDPFPHFAKQLQEAMLRYRLFTRTVGFVFNSGGKPFTSLASIPKGARIAVPKQNQALWDLVREYQKLDDMRFETVFTVNDENTLTESLRTGRWDTVFGDIRFLKPNQYVLGNVQEHFDLVVPETYTQIPAIKKLIDLILSAEFANSVATHKGCDVRSRGLLQEAHGHF